MYLRLLGTNDFPVKAENEKFAAAEMSEISEIYVKKVARKSVLHV